MMVGLAVGVAFSGSAFAAGEGTTGPSMYDEQAYTTYVQTTMMKLDKLYLQFCGSCGVSGEKAEKARREYLTLVRDLLQHMNARFDQIDPKKGGALSATETLVSIHAMAMLVDMLAEAQLQAVAPNPHN
jgi:hypothetical protein